MLSDLMMKRAGNYLTVTVAMLLCGSMSAIGWHEFYQVGIKQDINHYPFGCESAPWYYATAEMYTLVNFVDGALFGLLLVLGCWSVWKRGAIIKD